jgi:thioredoxin-dependent peroxiredoxin
MIERTGEAHELGEQLTVLGNKLQPGDKAPDFTLEHLDPQSNMMRSVSLADSVGKVRLLNVINSLDTPVCHIETRRWDDARSGLPDDVMLYTITMDLPFAAARWQQAENTNHETLSAHKTEQFSIDYGVLIKEWRLLQRAVFVLDRDDTVLHAEYVEDQMLEPDYDTALTIARDAAS